MSSSSSGSSVGSISTSVTFEPNAAKTQAHSQPMAPPPMISMLFGSSRRARAPSLSITLGPSAPGIGSFAGTEPVATMTFLVLTVSSVCAGHLDLAALGERPLPLNNLDAVALEQPADAARQAA